MFGPRIIGISQVLTLLIKQGINCMLPQIELATPYLPELKSYHYQTILTGYLNNPKLSLKPSAQEANSEITDFCERVTHDLGRV
jgi:hypothetical protein